MSDFTSLWNRLGVITALSEKATSVTLGHTVLMKYLYLLKVLRGIPLDYDFRLHIYGPFDSDVLDDLSYAKALEAVTSKIVYYPSGYGYEITAAQNADEIKKKASEFLIKHQDDINWIVEEFGEYNASMLELISTIIYVDREFSQLQQVLHRDKLNSIVRKIKPRFDESKIIDIVNLLKSKKLLKSVDNRLKRPKDGT